MQPSGITEEFSASRGGALARVSAFAGNPADTGGRLCLDRRIGPKSGSRFWEKLRCARKTEGECGGEDEAKRVRGGPGGGPSVERRGGRGRVHAFGQPLGVPSRAL